MLYSLQTLAAHYSLLLVGQSLGDTGVFKIQKSVRIHWCSMSSIEKPQMLDPGLNLHLGIPPWGSWVVPGDAGTCKRPRAGSHILWPTEPEPGWSSHNHLSEALNKYKTLQINNFQKSSTWYCLLYESRWFNFSYAQSAVFVSHPDELEPVHVATAPRLLFLKVWDVWPQGTCWWRLLHQRSACVGSQTRIPSAVPEGGGKVP